MVLGDIYVHNPRGSNNRLDEKSANRQTNNRVFDSQNNNKGGYNVGDKTDDPANKKFSRQYQMRYFQSGETGKTFMPIEWTHQHACGKNTEDDPIKVDCQVIIQYMCQPDTLQGDDEPNKDTLRDGVETGRNDYQAPQGANNRNRKNLQESSSSAANRKRNQNRDKRGMMEPFEWRDKCEGRPRNKGLFTADQNVNKDQAIATRQNPNGNRNGYECAEERDYYPYWHPADWKDAAILVEDISRCNELTSESFNVKPKHECIQQFTNGGEAHYSFAETKAKCDAANGEWREIHSYLEKLTEANGNPPTSAGGCNTLADQKNIPRSKVEFAYAIYGKQKECLVKLEKPDCLVASYSRDNHLGNVDGDTMQTNQYNWQMPIFPSGETQRCALRVRYNISTEDYSPNLDSNSNGNNSPIKNNPEVDVGLPNNQKLRLAINTAQTGRTFQDRSHIFLLKKRTAEIGEKDLYNMNVRGKRGNIVQTYPAVEYDFVPNNLKIGTSDAMHIQWTGSNTHDNNPPGGDGQTGDDGQGEGGTDRSNIVSMPNSGVNFFTPLESPDTLAANVKDVHWSAKPIGSNKEIDIGLQWASAGHYSCYDCSHADSFRKKKNQSGGKMDQLLNNAPASYEGMVVSFKKTGEFPFGCTRNNNFSNRSQKNKITVVNGKARR